MPLLIMIRVASCSRLLHGLREKSVCGYPASISTAALQRQKLTEDDVNKKIFEFRSYAICPDKFGECMKIIESNIHIRTAHSKLVGFWITEMGGINEVHHLWEFGKSSLMSPRSATSCHTQCSLFLSPFTSQ